MDEERREGGKEGGKEGGREGGRVYRLRANVSEGVAATGGGGSC